MIGSRRCMPGPLLPLVGALVLATGSAAAQTGAAPLAGAIEPTTGVRVPASVDYVSADGIYLGVGADAGALRGDTVDVFADVDAAEPMGSVVFTSVTRRRSVVEALGLAREVRTGETLFVALQVRAASSAPTTDGAGAATVEAARAASTSPRSAAAGRGVRVSGRLALELDARATRTSWSGGLFGETERRFATPTSRLALVASGLPGGLDVRANLRATYRYDDLPGGPPSTTVRAYELAAVKRFQAVPLEVMVGRFANPYEGYSAYWDGALVRLGGTRGPGVGVAVGFEPALHDEGFSDALPKVTGFTNLALRGSAWRYDTDVSVHFLRPTRAARRGFIGWSQRLSVGSVDISQRVRVEGGVDGRPWDVSDLRLRARWALSEPLGVRATYGRSRATWMAFDPAVLGLLPIEAPAREELGLGIDLTGGSAWLSLDGDRMARDGAETSLSLAGSLGVRLRAVDLHLAVRRWARDAAETIAVAPGAGWRLGPTEWRVGYRYYRADLDPADDRSHAAEASVAFALARALHVSLSGERIWGPTLRGTRARISLWRSF